MRRFLTWAGVTVGFLLGVPLSAAGSGVPVDWASPLDMAFGAAVALWVLEERTT